MHVCVCVVIYNSKSDHELLLTEKVKDTVTVWDYFELYAQNGWFKETEKKEWKFIVSFVLKECHTNMAQLI